jgi:hypothetical protein
LRFGILFAGIRHFTSPAASRQYIAYQLHQPLIRFLNGLERQPGDRLVARLGGFSRKVGLA